MESNFRNFFTKIYNKAGYFDKYGDSIAMSFMFLFTFFVLYNYLRLKSNFLPIRKNWEKHKCRPNIIPLAGFIHEKENPMEFASKNFAECNNDVLSSIVGSFTAPAFLSSSMILDVFAKLLDSVNGIRTIINKILTFIAKIMETIMKLIMAILKPIIDLISHVFDTLIKSSTILNIVFNVIQTIIFSFVSFVGIFIRKIIIILTAFTATMLALIAIVVGVPFFGWWAAIPLAIVTAAYTVLAIVLSKIIIFSTDIKNIVGSAAGGQDGECDFDPFVCDPDKPEYDDYCCDPDNKKDYPGDYNHKCCCFDGDTIFETLEGNIPIKELKAGMVLKDKGVINAVMKLCAENETMYNIRGIKVSGSHKVQYDGKFINVSDHPESIKIKNENENYKENETKKNSFIYCLNTSTKKIVLNDLTFSDWDEIFIEDIHYLRKHGFIPKEASFDYINQGFHRGFSNKNLVLMDNKEKKPIKDIVVGDILDNNNKVIGIVELLIGKHKTDDLEIHDTKYNLITEKGIININGGMKIDYDAALYYIFGY